MSIAIKSLQPGKMPDQPGSGYNFFVDILSLVILKVARVQGYYILLLCLQRTVLCLRLGVRLGLTGGPRNSPR